MGPKWLRCAAAAAAGFLCWVVTPVPERARVGFYPGNLWREGLSGYLGLSRCCCCCKTVIVKADAVGEPLHPPLGAGVPPSRAAESHKPPEPEAAPGWPSCRRRGARDHPPLPEGSPRPTAGVGVAAQTPVAGEGTSLVKSGLLGTPGYQTMARLELSAPLPRLPSHPLPTAGFQTHVSHRHRLCFWGSDQRRGARCGRRRHTPRVGCPLAGGPQDSLCGLPGGCSQPRRLGSAAGA